MALKPLFSWRRTLEAGGAALLDNRVRISHPVTGVAQRRERLDRVVSCGFFWWTALLEEVWG